MSLDESGSRGVRRIQARVMLLVGVGMLGPLGVVGYARWKGQEEMQRQALAGRALLARFIAERAEVLLSSEMKDLETVAAPLRTAFDEPTIAGRRAALREEFVRHHALFDSVFLLDARGEVLAQEGNGRRALDGPRLLAEARRAGRPAFTQLDADPSEAPRVYALVPLGAPNGELQGVVGGAIDPRGPHLAAIFKGWRMAPGESVDLVDGDGAVLASTQAVRLFHPSPHAGALRGFIRERRGLSGAHDGTGTVEAGDLVAFAPLTVARWGVSVQQPEEQALAVSGALSRNVAMLNVLLFAVALLFAWGAARSVTKPLATLTRAAERLTEGALEQPIPPLPEDEVGRLGAALERMRVALQESLERVAKANAVLEQRVAERTAELERLNRELQAREESVHDLLGKVITAQEDERRRVARELHDETTGSLAALTMRVQSAMAAAPPGELRTKMEEANALAVQTLDEVHRLIAALRPSVLDDLGLKSAIQWYADRHLERKGIAVRCEFTGLEGRLPPQVETVVFRVVQEAMTNISKHAKAESVLVQASTEGGQLKVEVEDDGVGFEPGALVRPRREGGGWGLLGMRERVEMLGGRLRLDSAKGKGTRLELVVPLPAEAAHG